jgi:hypothetical protein
MTITAEILEAASTKGRLKEYWAGYRKLHNSDPEQRRHPDTVIGFLSKEKLHEILTNPPDENMLINACGVALFDNDEVAFFADDGQYGYGVLPRDLMSCLISNIRYRYGEGQRFSDVDAIIDTFFKGKRFLNSEQELLDYLNGKLPHDTDPGGPY